MITRVLPITSIQKKLRLLPRLSNRTESDLLGLIDSFIRARAELEGLQAWKRKNVEYITSKMLYPQFLFALMRLSEKRKSGFQEVRIP